MLQTFDHILTTRALHSTHNYFQKPHLLGFNLVVNSTPNSTFPLNMTKDKHKHMVCMDKKTNKA